ncbi:hypothetical protein BJY01DRAFT_256479 [Aspergillus pseudoustus]|uniref:Uncharacterized protein n=1 Tax=Aspergillus pseudoustus TaxID=1810923 RepID=A0ABR4I9A2_9EURO
MLYIYVIQNRAYPAEVYSSYFSAATRCQSHLSAIAEKGSLSERYCLVLEELRVEATRQTRSVPVHNQSQSHIPAPTATASHPHPLSQTQSQPQPQGTGTTFPTQHTGSQIPLVNHSPGAATTSNSNYTDSLVNDDGAAALDFETNMAGLGFSDTDCVGWGQFTSMVSSGLGNLDLLLEGEGFRF